MKDYELAKLFHETYEKLAPRFGYLTRKESRRPWKDVPDQNKTLMIAVAGEILEHLEKERAPSPNKANPAVCCRCGDAATEHYCYDCAPD